VTQGLGSPDVSSSGGFTRGGWGAPYAAAMGQVVSPDGLAHTSGYLFGRRTYEKMAAFWPGQPDTDPMANSLNHTPKYVVSRTLTDAEWPGTRILRGDLAAEVQEVRAGADGDLVVLGSGMLCRALLTADLVDELRLFVHPLLLGAGRLLFAELPEARPLALTSVSSTDLGTVALVYDLRR
jgi:dihydrofolate reductase